ncbi:hypothetical protein FIBSPDRAFT_898376 [Athelia psychrophila]|uniref:Uncharacterized protein n=1 Tax=Athelia psychrophila TaxID=1759441 RepID=A0A166B0M5_9AGAM|nr:hypothetical protein FIBSPDRAFT_898376 [Fibularhizoctonia sp. CBS 109695]
MSLKSLKQQLSKKSLSHRAHPDSMTTWSASIRLGVFACLELAWIILAVVCRIKVIEIGDGDMLRIKTVWITFAVLYQVIATAPLVGVLAGIAGGSRIDPKRAAGELTLQALGNTSKSNINGVAYFSVGLI